MTLKLMVAKLQLHNKKFITREELREYCRDINLDYYTTIRYLTYYKHLARIFKGIFYIKTIEERKFNKTDISYPEIIKKALYIKGIRRWYFGLETALKLNNMTHEYFAIDYVISDSLFRAKPITILGHKIRFVKLAHSLVSFGLKKNNVPYSDPEKTALDLLYLKKYSKGEFMDLSRKLSKNKLIIYSKHYNKRIREVVKEYDG